jgi:uncharacterized Fe-S cluster-containing radical SAM superfamily enzyme
MSYGLLAEFKTPERLLTATEEIRRAGFTVFDAYTPFRFGRRHFWRKPWIWYAMVRQRH